MAEVHFLDARGLKCPVPKLKMTAVYAKMKRGDVLEVIGDCPTFEKDTRDSLTRIEAKGDMIDKKVSYTNGKVRKIIIAIVLVFGILIGRVHVAIQVM